jgi:hypothetical protein
MLQYFVKCDKNIQVSLKPAKYNLHSTCRPIHIYLSRIARGFIKFEMSETKFVYKPETNLLYSLKFFFLESSTFLNQCGNMRCNQTGHRWQYNTLRAHCMLDFVGGICNIIALPQQQWLRESTSILPLYVIYYMSCYLVTCLNHHANSHYSLARVSHKGKAVP